MASVNGDGEEVVLNRVLTAPNAISFARLLLVPVFLLLYVVGRVLPAMIVLAVVGTSDFVDGFVARATGQVSLLGGGAVLYWAAGFLYAREIRRLLAAKAGDGGG